MAQLINEDFTGFTGAGFAPEPTAAQLDSDIIVPRGLSDGPTAAFGFTGTTGDFARGVAPGNPSGGGIYAAPSTSARGEALLYQPTGTDGDPNGGFLVRLANTSGSTITDANLSFDWAYKNNGTRSSALTVEYSTDNVTFTAIPAGAFTIPATPGDNTVLYDTNTNLAISGLNVAANGFLYLRFRQTSSGSGDRDEFGIDNLIVDTVTNGTAAGETLTGTDTPDIINGLAGDDILQGAGGNDTLSGGEGNDRLDGGRGGDTLTGGVGDDTYLSDTTRDVLTEDADAGIDTVLANNSFTLGANFENLTLTGIGIDSGTGNALNNRIVGQSFANVLSGLAGDDILQGGGGNDTLNGGANNDVLRGEDGRDTLNGGADDDLLDGGVDRDTLNGEAGIDTLEGGAGNDVLDGGAGADTLTGGGDRDFLTGGADADTFVFLAEGDSGLTGSTYDRILDFSRADGDQIDLSAIDAIAGGSDDAFSLDAGPNQLLIKSYGTYSIVRADTNGDGTIDFALYVEGVTDLVAGDFVL